MKAGKSSATAMVLPSLLTNALLASKVLSSVAMPRITSTSSISGTGFMKWMPMNRSGRSVEAASRVMEIDEVFVARIASGLQDLADVGEDLALDVFLLGRGLDDKVAIGKIFQLFGRLDAADRGLARIFGDRFLRNLARHIAVDRGESLLDPLRRQVVELHVEARQRADMGDAVAHLSRADHTDFANCLRHKGLVSEIPGRFSTPIRRGWPPAVTLILTGLQRLILASSASSSGSA